MVTPTKIAAPNSDVRFNSRGAPYSDSHLSSGALDLDPQITFEACISDDAQVSHGAPEAGSQHTNSRKKWSAIWKYFTVETVGDSLPRAVCNKCKQSFSLITRSNNRSSGTSHLKRHLNRHIAHTRVSQKNLQRTEIAQIEAASSSVGVLFSASTGAHEASGSRKRSRSDQQDNELIVEIVERGDVADGETISHIRKTVETGLEIQNKGGQHLVDKPKRKVENNGSSNIYLQQKNQDSTQQRNLPFDQENCSLEMVKMIIRHDYPLDMVENPRFIKFSGALQPRYKICNINIIEEQISKLYLTEKQNTFRILAGIPGRVSLALDLLSDDQSFGYVILTGQFLDSDWKLQRRILSVIKLPFPDSEVAFNHAVTSCITDWGLETKLFSLTLNDNFSNEIVRQNLRGLLWINNPRILNGQLIIGSCYARALNDVARVALASMDVLVKKVRKNVKYVVTLEAHGVNLNELRQKLKVSSTRDLEIDDQTKWNTTYEMLVAASKLKKVYNHYCILVPGYKETVSVEEWRKVETLTMYLKILHDAITVLHDGGNPTADLLFHQAWKIQAELMNGASSQDHFVSNLTKPLKECFDTYWKDCSLILAVAVVMDPRFKMKFIESCFSEMYGENAVTWIKMIDERLRELFEVYFGESIPPPPSPYTDKIGASVEKTEMGLEQDDSFFTSDDFLEFDFYLARIMGEPLSRSELDEYLDESLLANVQDFDVLDWWKQNSSKYPILSRMASDILCIPVSNGLDQDTVFDMAEKRMDRGRSGLKPSTLEALVCLKNWLNFA